MADEAGGETRWWPQPDAGASARHMSRQVTRLLSGVCRVRLTETPSY